MKHNPMGRMKTEPVVTEINLNKGSNSQEVDIPEAAKPVINQEVENLDAYESQEKTESKEATDDKSTGGIPEEELLTDLNMEQFYFTGKLEHTFNIGKLEVVLGLISSEETEETNKILWQLMSDENSMDMLRNTHSIEVIGRSIVSYGKVRLEGKTKEEKVAYVRKNIPGILVPIIARKYAILEASASAILTGDGLKN